ncbi:MAG: CinA family protein [Candidatus Limnocylindria bacterium]
MARPPVPTEDDLELAAVRLGERLRAHGWRLSTAESSTGGLIGHAITMIPGASAYYVGGVICYTNQAKQVELGVPRELIEQHGAVSAEVAEAMAEGARHRFGVELGLATTGIAGPDGGSEGKPVGLHFVAAAFRGRPTLVEQRAFGHDREGNKAAAALLALDIGLREVTAAAQAG